MTLENHPASFDSIARSEVGADDVPPSTWRRTGVDYDLVPNGQGWDVICGDRLLGCLEHDLPDPQAPLHWRVRDPQHENFGIGASWGDWQDAVIALIDFRDRRDAEGVPHDGPA
jgi:hypothetical protein